MMDGEGERIRIVLMGDNKVRQIFVVCYLYIWASNCIHFYIDEVMTMSIQMDNQYFMEKF